MLNICINRSNNSLLFHISHLLCTTSGQTAKWGNKYIVELTNFE